MAQYDVDLRDYWRILKKRKLVVILMVGLVGISSYGFAKLKEPLPVYTASASVKIERSDKLAGFMGFFWDETENVVTQAFIITSFPVLVETAKLTGMLPTDTSDEEIRSTKSYLAVIQRLKGMVQAEHVQGTRIVNISVTSSDNKEAAAVANSVARAYRQYNIQEKNRQTFETKKFIEKQLEITSGRLSKAEENLRVFKEDYALTALDAQTLNTLNKLFEVEKAHEEVKRQKEKILSWIDLMDNGNRPLNDFKGAFAINVRSDRIRELSGKLSDLILKRKTLLFDYTDRHPKVRVRLIA